MTLDRRFEAAVWAALVVFCVATALVLGQDRNFDLLNYHVFSSWALFNGLLFEEMYAFQQLLNPAVLLPIYLALQLPPVWSTVLLAALHAVGPGLAMLLVLRGLPPSQGPWRFPLVILVGAVAVTGPFFVSLLGTTFSENLTAIPILLGLVIVGPTLVTGVPLAIVRRRLFQGALCFGLAVGLKLTNAVYALAATAALIGVLACLRPWRDLPGLSLAWAVGGILGGMPCFIWAGVLQLQFGSPTFPFFNDLFRSPAGPVLSFADTRFQADGISDLWAVPLRWANGGPVFSELPFRDFRFLLALPFAVLVAPLALWSTWRREPGRMPPGKVAFVTLFFLIAYALWLGQFAIRRYALPLELLSPVVIAVAVLFLLRTPLQALLTVLMTAIIALPTTQRPEFAREIWRSQWFALEMPAEELPGPGAAIVVPNEPSGFVRPALSHVGVMTGVLPWTVGFAMVKDRLAAVDAEDGPLYWVRRIPFDERETSTLTQAGFVPDQSSCRHLGQELFLCDLYRAGEVPFAPLQPRYTPGEVLHLGRNRGAEAFMYGHWTDHDEQGARVGSPDAGLKLPLDRPPEGPLALEVRLTPDWIASTLDTVSFVVNGGHVGTVHLDDPAAGDVLRFPIPPERLGDGTVVNVQIAFSVADALEDGRWRAPLIRARTIGVSQLAVVPLDAQDLEQ